MALAANFEPASGEAWFTELIYWESFIFQLFSLIFAVICLFCSIRYCRHGRSQWSPFHGLALAQSVIALISDVTELLTVGQLDCSTFGLASLLLSHAQATMHTFLMLARLRVFRHVSGVPDRFRSVLQWGIPVVYGVIEITTLTDACSNAKSLADFQDRRTMFTIWRVFSALVNLGAAMSMYLSLARIRRAQRYPSMNDAIEHDARMARAQWHIQWSACTIPIELVVVLASSKYPSLSSAISAALLRLLLLGQIMMLSSVNKVMAYAYLYAAARGSSSSGSGVTGASAVASSTTSKLPHAITKSPAGVPKTQSLASNPMLSGANQPTSIAHHVPTHQQSQSTSIMTGSPANVVIQHAAHHNYDTPGTSSNLSFSADDVAVRTSNPGLRAGPRLLWALSTVGLSSIAKGSHPALSCGSLGAFPSPLAVATLSAKGLPLPSAPNQTPQSRANLHPGSATPNPAAGSSPPRPSLLVSSSIMPTTVSPQRRGSAASIMARTTAVKNMGGAVARHPSIPITLSEASTDTPNSHSQLEPTLATNIPISLRSTGASLAATSAFETPSSTHSRHTASSPDSHVHTPAALAPTAANFSVIAPSNTLSLGSTNLASSTCSASASAAVLAVALDRPTGSQMTTAFGSNRTAPGSVSSSKSVVSVDDRQGG